MCGGSFRKARDADDQRQISQKADVARAQARQEETTPTNDLVNKQEAEAGFQALEQRRQDSKSDSEARRRAAQFQASLDGQSEERLLNRFLDGEKDIPRDRVRRIRNRIGTRNFGV